MKGTTTLAFKVTLFVVVNPTDANGNAYQFKGGIIVSVDSRATQGAYIGKMIFYGLSYRYRYVCIFSISIR